MKRNRTLDSSVAANDLNKKNYIYIIINDEEIIWK
jgi:hypothetical protein